MRVLTVVGNRPQFVKAAAVSRRLRDVHDEVLVHTGQHHDDELSAVFFAELDLPAPDHWLGVSGATNTSQLGRMLAALEPLLEADAVLVYGDTNSTLAGALAAADRSIPVVHVEAGMRSFDRTMPEERNRVLCDQLSALLLCSSAGAALNLRREAVPGRVEVVGDVMVDVALAVQPRARERGQPLADLGVAPGAYLLATAHRAANVDDPARLERLVELLEAIEEPIVLPLPPRTRARARAAGLQARLHR
ncbi:MAG TPA: UDP-N-acetylglucosamine 2-epimerase, partial [Solirubrobacteraceae bacterium]|nr:UDP-N-acetylglucosamine 2-epimerase [Solirubrobacteraceae bacterium]